MTRMLVYGLVGFLLAGLFGSLEYINVLHLHLVLLESTAIALATRPSLRPRTGRRWRPYGGESRQPGIANYGLRSGE